MIRLLLATLLLLPLAATAQIYKTVDSKGNVSYSDTPPASGPSEEVELRTTNTTPAPAAPQAQAVPADAAAGPSADTAPISYSLAITSPANETTFPMGPGNFSVSVSVDPAPAEDAVLQLYIDGSPYDGPQSGNSWSLTNVFRGAHDLQVKLGHVDGKTLAESDTVRVYVLRPSVNSPNKSRPRPTPH